MATVETLTDQAEEKDRIVRAATAWRQFLETADLGALFHIAGDVEDTPDGKIYPIEPPAEWRALGLEGDFALVDMADVVVDTAHYHSEGETEVHIPLAGSAVMSIGERLSDMHPGKTEVVETGTPHFILPGQAGYLVGVVSLPNYDPEHQVPVDVANPPAEFNAGLYASVGSQQNV